jgi:putative endonuclease
MHLRKCPCVYVLASRCNGTLYVGVTSDLNGRMFDHRESRFLGFTSKYVVTMLVYYEMHQTMDDARRN